MTTISKILALLTTAGCFAFLGFVLVALVAGPNWEGMTNEFPAYSFENSGGENPTWTAKLRTEPSKTVSNSPILAKTIVDVLSQKKSLSQAKIQVLDNGQPGPPGSPPVQMGINQLDQYLNHPQQGIKAMILRDLAALNAQGQSLETNLVTAVNEVQTVTQQITMVGQEINEKDIEAKRRREDKYRLENLITEAKTDEYRAIEHQEKLRDVWQRYQGVIERLEQRQTELKNQLKKRSRKPYED